MDSESEIFEEAIEANLKPDEEGAQLIASGSRFAYWRVEHDGRYFFFKTLSTDSDFARKLLRREYELSAVCDHPHIARSFLFGTFLPGREGILMEYVDGHTLTEFLAENPSAEARRKVFGQLLEAVVYLHGKELVHNDLKPDNILISRHSNVVKLIDFGLADDDAHFLLKTPGCSDAYAAPELRDDRRSDARSDVYSLGKIMRLIFGKRYGRIRRKSLRSNPDRRYRDARKFSRAWARRRRPFIITLSALLCCIVAVSIVAIVGNYRQTVREQATEVDRLRTSYSEISGSYDELNRSYEDVNGKYEEVNGKYNEVKGDYEDMQEQYNGMKENLEAERLEAERHEKALNIVTDKFRADLEVQCRKASAELKQCKSLREVNEVNQRYLLEFKALYDACPKTAAGEDIQSAVLSVYSSKYEELSRLVADRRLQITP